MDIFADAGYNDPIEGTPHKVRLIQFQGKVDAQGNFANVNVG